MTFQQFLLILRARWKVVVGTLALVFATTLVVSLLLPERFTASTSVLVDVKSSDPIMGALLPAQMLPGYMATQIDIVTSDRVAERVVKLLKLDQVPAIQRDWRGDNNGQGTISQWLAVFLKKHLDVRPARESSVINIEFSGTDPRFAAAVADAFARAYIETNLELKVDPARQFAEWFDDRNKQLRDNLEKAQTRLSSFQREQGIVASDERIDVETARLNELSSQLTAIQAARVESQSRQKQAGTGNETLPEVLQNPLIAGLKSDIARSEAQLEDMRTRLGKNHPDFIKTESQINSLRERLTLETRRIASSLGTADQVNVQREAEIRASLERQKKKVLELKTQRDELAVMQRDVENAQRVYDLTTQRLAQTNLESQARQTNIVVLTPAQPPIEPSSPKLLLNSLIAVFLGLLLGVGTALMLELMDQRVRGAEGLSQLIPAPFLGSIPPAQARRGRWLSRKSAA